MLAVLPTRAWHSASRAIFRKRFYFCRRRRRSGCAFLSARWRGTLRQIAFGIGLQPPGDPPHQGTCLWFDRDSCPNTTRYFTFNCPTVWCRTPSISCHIGEFCCRFTSAISLSVFSLWRFASDGRKPVLLTPEQSYTLFGTKNASPVETFSTFRGFRKARASLAFWQMALSYRNTGSSVR